MSNAIMDKHLSFPYTVRLNSHKRVVHGQPKPEMRKPHPCPHCSYVAGKGSHLKRHINRKHAAAENAFPERYEAWVPIDNEVMYSQQLYIDMPNSTIDPTAGYIMGTK